VFGFQGRIL